MPYFTRYVNTLSRIIALLCIASIVAEAYIASLRFNAPRTARSTLLRANPVSSQFSRLRVSEDEALHWFDRAYVKVKGGAGGRGANTVKFGMGRVHAFPNGGSGGDGGSVFFVGDERLNTLLKFQGAVSYRAAAGEDGDAHYVNGRRGADLHVKVPVGTVVRDNVTEALIANITEDKQVVMVAKGGVGGKGNAAAKSGRRDQQKVLPPLPPESRVLKLEMRLLADVALVGVPNCGKSTLLSRITNATPKIASYAFTTKVPNIGVCDVSLLKPGEDPILVADVPGLLEGAHRGRGLGRAFLRHVESCRLLVHIVDGLSQDPVGDFKAINRELALFSPVLAAKPQVVVLNKIDAEAVKSKSAALLEELRAEIQHSRVMEISALTSTNVDELVLRMAKLLKAVKQQTPVDGKETFSSSTQQGDEDADATFNVDVQDDGRRVVVEGRAVQKLLRMVDWTHYNAMSHFMNAAEALGIFEQIAAATPTPVTGARVQFQGSQEKREFRWCAESGELLPQP